MEGVRARQAERGKEDVIKAMEEKRSDPRRLEHIESSKEMKANREVGNFIKAMEYIRLGMRATTLATEVAKVIPKSTLSAYIDHTIEGVTVKSMMADMEQEEHGGTLPSHSESTGNRRFRAATELAELPEELEKGIVYLFGLEGTKAWLDKRIKESEQYEEAVEWSPEDSKARAEALEEIEGLKEERDLVTQLQKDIETLGGEQELERLLELNG